MGPGFCCEAVFFFFFSFFVAKSFIISIWSKAWERAPGCLKNCLVAADRGFRQKPCHQRAPQRPLGSGGTYSCLMVSLSKRYSPSPAWGPASLQRWVSWSPIFLMSFTSSSRKWLLRKSQRRGSERVGPRACRSKRAWFKFFSMRMVASIVSWVLPHHLEMASARPGRGHGRCTGFAFSRDARCPRTSPQPILEKGGLCPPEPQCWGWNRSLERGRCRRPKDARWPGGWWRPPLWWSNSDESGSLWLIGNKKLSSKNGVGWSRWLRIAEWLILKVVTGKKVGGWLEAGVRGVPVSVLSTHCWSKRDPRDHCVHCWGSFLESNSLSPCIQRELSTSFLSRFIICTIDIGQNLSSDSS